MALDDAKSTLSNPAVMSFQRSQVGLGVRGHHVGLGGESGVPLRQGYFTASTPFLFQDIVGVGGTVQYFDSPIFNQGKFGVSASAQFLRMVSVGVRVSALNLSYNQGEFVGVDPDNPVFQEGTSTTSLSVDAGVFVQPLPELHLSVGARDINRPNLSLVDDAVRAHMEWFAGAAYGYGPARARVEVVNSQFGVQGQIALEAYQTNGSFLRLGSNTDFSSGHAEAQLHVRGPLSVGYRYDLPFNELQGASSGSHSFSLTYEFGRTPEVEDPPPLPPNLLEAQDAPVEPEYPAKLYLATDDEYMQHFEKRIEREIDVPDDALLSLSREDLGELDPESFGSDRWRIDGEPAEPPSDEIEIADLLSETYDLSLEELEQRLADDPGASIVLQGRDQELVKAMGIRNRLLESGIAEADQIRIEEPTDERDATPVDPDDIPTTEQMSILNPEDTRLYLLAPYLEGDGGSWELTVADQVGQTVRTFTGLGDVPEQIEWDWGDDQGEPLDEGIYTYQLTWTGPDGEETLTSNDHTLYVRKVERNVTIEITQDPSTITEPADGVELRLER